MDLNYPEEFYSNISTQENYLVGTGRSYECIFCKRGFTTAQALGGHMNIHRKQRANNNNNNTKPTFPPPSTSSNKVDADLLQIPTQSTASHANTFPHLCFPPTALTVTPSHAELLCAEKNQLGHWRTTNFSFYSNPLCFHEIKNKFEDTEENGLDLELRLGHHP